MVFLACKFGQKYDRIRLALRVVTTVCCLVGCFYHGYSLTSRYLKYETQGIYAPYIPRTQTVSNLALCFTLGLEDAANSTFMEYKMNETAIQSFNSHSQVEASEIIEKCRFRNLTSGSSQETNCDSFFSVTRSLSVFYECFSLFPREKYVYNVLQTLASTTARSFVYKVSLTPHWSKRGRIVPMINFKIWPHEEFLFSSDLDISGEGSKYFHLYYMMFVFKRLPLPYDTDCVQEHHAQCIISHDRSIDENCRKPLCEQNITITFTQATEVHGKGIHLEIDTIASPSRRVMRVAKFRQEDYFIQVCSVLGLWLNLSFILCSRKLIAVGKYLLRSKQYKDSARKFLRLQTEIMGLATRARINFTALNAYVINKMANRKPAKKNRWLKAGYRFAKVLIVLLCFIELLNITIDYSKYRTMMKIDIELKSAIEYPEVSYCIEMEGMLNITAPDYWFDVYDSEMNRLARGYNYTMRQLFGKIPPVDSVVKMCRVRNSTSSPLNTFTNCSRFFQVDKFWQSNFMCYKFKPTLNHKVDAAAIRRNIHQPAVLFTLSLDEKIVNERIQQYQLIVSYGFPSMSRFLSNRVYKKKPKMLKVLSFFTYWYQELPAPYDTDCVEMGSFSGCNIKCMNLSAINRIPYSELYEHSVDEYVINYIDMKNRTVMDILRDREEKCEKICRRDCIDDFTKTISSYEYSSNEHFELALLIPAQPSYKLQAIPFYTFTRFIYQIACCSSFWLGFSLIKLNRRWSSAEDAPKARTRQEYLNAMVDQLERIIFARVRGVRNRYFRVKLKVKFKSNFLYKCFFVICSTCFCYQCYDATSYYFRYLTLLDTRLRFEKNYDALCLTMCMTIEQLDLKNNYSLSNIFDKSPDPKSIMVECGHRGMNLKQLSHLPPLLKQRVMPWVNSSEVCYRHFNVNKMLTFGMVCYVFDPKPGSQDAEYNPKYHILEPKAFLYATISNELAKYNLTVTASQGRPSLSLFFSSHTQIGLEKTTDRWYWVGYEKFFVDSLPYPYDMGIYIGIKHQKCVRRCVDVDARKRGRLSSYGREFQPLNLTHETLEEFMAKESEKLRKKCEAKCDLYRFYGSLLINFTDGYTDGPYTDDWGFGGSVSYWVRTSDYLVTHTKFIPSLRLVDLILSIGTSFSIWFGLSCLEVTDLLFKAPYHHSDDDLTEILQLRLKKLKNLVTWKW